MNNKNGVYRQIFVGIVIVLTTGWITYISFRGLDLAAVVSGIHTRVAVLETVASTLKEDIGEIKILIREVREDQKRIQRGNR